MAKNRMVSTRFWDDTYISELNPEEKLLFLYFLTNPATNISGVYELPLRTVAVETGIGIESVRQTLSRFTMDGKIIYEQGWVVIKNFVKHQNTNNSKIFAGIQAELALAPEGVRKLAGKYESSHLIQSNLIKSNLIQFKSGDESPSTPVFEREIREKGEEYRKLVQDLASKDFLSPKRIHTIATEEFLPYWLERSPNAKKARWEKESAFDYKRRFQTWVRRYHEGKKDIKCSAAGMWHVKGESCHHAPKEIDYKKLPTSSFAKELALTKSA